MHGGTASGLAVVVLKGSWAVLVSWGGGEARVLRVGFWGEGEGRSPSAAWGFLEGLMKGSWEVRAHDPGLQMTSNCTGSHDVACPSARWLKWKSAEALRRGSGELHALVMTDYKWLAS